MLVLSIPFQPLGVRANVVGLPKRFFKRGNSEMITNIRKSTSLLQITTKQHPTPRKPKKEGRASD
jgi:hypothetical protein